MFKRKQISEFSWMIFEDGKPFGFLRENGAVLELLVSNERFEFSSYEELTKMFGKIVDVEVGTKELTDIKGFPARHPGAEAIPHATLPKYSVGGNTVYVAGYFALKFTKAKAWQVVHSPKLATIEANEIVGPFKTRLEALREVNVANRRIENEKDQ